MGGIDSLKGRIILLPDARMDYTPAQIRRFIKMYDEGHPISNIAAHFYITHHEVWLLILHCGFLEGWIEPREGGLTGTLPPKKRKRK